jgi:hypothetical protein
LDFVDGERAQRVACIGADAVVLSAANGQIPLFECTGKREAAS